RVVGELLGAEGGLGQAPREVDPPVPAEALRGEPDVGRANLDGEVGEDGVAAPDEGAPQLDGVAVAADPAVEVGDRRRRAGELDRKSTRLNSSHVKISYAVFCLKKKK